MRKLAQTFNIPRTTVGTLNLATLISNTEVAAAPPRLTVPTDIAHPPHGYHQLRDYIAKYFNIINKTGKV